MARETGLEPATPTVTGWYSNQLSYSPALRCLIAFAILLAFQLALYKILVFLFFASSEMKKNEKN